MQTTKPKTLLYLQIEHNRCAVQWNNEYRTSHFLSRDEYIDYCLTTNCPQWSELEFHQRLQQSPADTCPPFCYTVNHKFGTINHWLLCWEINSWLASSHISFMVCSSVLDISSHIISQSHLVKCWHPYFQPWHKQVTKIKNAAHRQIHLKLCIATDCPLPEVADKHIWGKMLWCPANPHSYIWILSIQQIYNIIHSTTGSMFTIHSSCSLTYASSLWLCSVFG